MVFTTSNNNNNKTMTLPVVKEDPPGGGGDDSSLNRSQSSKSNAAGGDGDSHTDGDSGTGGLSHAKSIEMDNDSKCMKTSRIVILVSLLMAGIIAGGVTYYSVSKSEELNFEDEVRDIIDIFVRAEQP
jgi:hypothetical protein